MRHATQILDDISQNFDAYFHARRITDAIAFDRMERLAQRIDGGVEVLLKLLELRFGPVPAKIRTHIEGATREQLDTWVGRVLTAGSLDEVLAV